MNAWFVLVAMVISSLSHASSTRIEFVRMNALCSLRVVSEIPEKKHVADILFLTGFSDRADNHKPLFSLLAGQGFRVISFDYPSHGETNCLSLNLHNFTTISNLAEELLARPAYRSAKPLYLSGWSTGGLMVYRMLQRNFFEDRDVRGAVLLAPGLAVYPVPGVGGLITQDSLLSHPTPPHRGPIWPRSPFMFPAFSGSLLVNSELAKGQAVPRKPILMLLGDDRLDVYADTPEIRSWYLAHKRSKFGGYQCAGAKHEIDNEIEPIGRSARQLILNFLLGEDLGNGQGSCRKI